MSGYFRGAIDELIAFFLQPSCLVCGRTCGARALCGECRPIYPITGPQCDVCGAMMSQRVPKCGRCITRPRSPLTKTRSLFWLEEDTKKILHRAKYAHRFELLDHFYGAFEDHLDIFFPTDATIVPVPIHFWRRHRRGFNQAEILGGWFARLLRMPLDPRLLKKARATSPQAGLGEKAREANLRGSFGINPRRSVPRTVLLVDDVLTTGSTLETCARVLKRAGVEEVYAFTLFRSPLWATGLAISVQPLEPLPR